MNNWYHYGGIMGRELTILCCYNNRKNFEQLVENLKKQSIETEIIGIDNTGNTYQSCAEAFNDNLAKVKTKYVVFSHQDIALTHCKQLEKFLYCMKIANEYDLVGVAGRRSIDGAVITNIRHGSNEEYAGKTRIDKLLVECDTIDECFFGGTTSCFTKNPFNQELCNNWHLYAVERSLSARARGNKVYVCGIPLIHYSTGRMNHVYNKQFYMISKAYCKQIGYIYSTCASASTKFPAREWAYLRRKISIATGRYYK